MNVLYAKVVLYAYAHLDALADQIDEIVEKKAFSSSMNFSPALNQFEDIIGLTYQKQVVFALKLCALDALKSFNDKEKLCLDYKYFKRLKIDAYAGLDTTSRAYFRLQVKLAEKFAKYLEKAGYSDERFESECLSMEFFREMLARVKERENLSRKNKTDKEKAEIKMLKDKIAENAVRNTENSVRSTAISA